MGKVLTWLFEIAALLLGVYFIWPDLEYFLKSASAEPGRLPFLKAVERGEHALLYFTLILLPAMHLLHKILGRKVYSALVVLLFSGLSIVFAQILHAFLIDGYVFMISKQKAWSSIARPAGILVIVGGNWLIAFSEMYRVVKVAGKD